MRHDDDNNSFSEGAEEESNKTTPTLVPSINRKLDFDEKSSPISKEINMYVSLNEIEYYDKNIYIL